MSDYAEESERRINELCVAVKECDAEMLEEVFSQVMSRAQGDIGLAAWALNIQCAATNIYVGELHRRITDLKEQLKLHRN